jgi:hypothetical protein
MTVGYRKCAMTREIRNLRLAQPFVPFTIHTADGGQLRVPTDHVFVTPTGSRVFVAHDDDTYDVFSVSIISRITVPSGTAS